MPQRALLLLNPKARQGQANLDPALQCLQEHGLQLIEVTPTKKQNLSDIIRSHQGQVDLVIVGGGDGTLNGALDGLVDTQLPLGILPLGTANDLARTLGIPNDPSRACDIIGRGNQRKIDLGWVNGKHFLNVASIGISVQITQELTREVKSRWGIFAYLFTAIRVLFRARPFHAEIRSNGQAWQVKTVQIAIGNGRHYGGGMTVHKDARIDDGLLHLYSLEVNHWWQLMPLIPAMRRGALEKSKNARTLQGQAFEIRSLRRPRPLNTDGEIVGQTPCHFRLIPQALSVFAPMDPRPVPADLASASVPG